MYWWLTLGIATGMRTMTPIAVFCIFAAMGCFPGVHHTWAEWSASRISAVIFGVLALGEYIADLLPQTPSRREWGPAAARLVFGGLTGALAATAMRLPPGGGAVFGVLGAVIGTAGGWWVRTTLARKLGRDWPIGVAESMLALALAVIMVWRIQGDASFWNGVEDHMTMVLAPLELMTSPELPPIPLSPAARVEFPHSR